MSTKVPVICNPNGSAVTLGAGHKDKNIIVINVVNSTNESLRFSGRGASGTCAAMARS